MYCTECGFKLKGSVNFCSNCGTAVANEQRDKEQTVNANESNGHNVEEPFTEAPSVKGEGPETETYETQPTAVHELSSFTYTLLPESAAIVTPYTPFSFSESLKKIKKIHIIIGGAILAAITIAILLSWNHNRPINIYNRALALLEAGDYRGVVDELQPIIISRSHMGYKSDFRDAGKIATYAEGQWQFNNGQYENASIAFNQISDFWDSQAMIEIIEPLAAKDIYENAVSRYYTTLEFTDYFDINAFMAARADAKAENENESSWLIDGNWYSDWSVENQISMLSDSTIARLRSISHLIDTAEYSQKAEDLSNRLHDLQSEIEAYIYQEELQRQAKENAAFVKANLVGRWSSGAGGWIEFYDDGKWEQMAPPDGFLGGVIFSGIYFFDGDLLALRFSFLGLETEAPFHANMADIDSLSLIQVGESWHSREFYTRVR